MTTTQIIERAAKSDPEARGLIYSEFKDFVWHISIGIAKNSRDAEDIASEVFVKVFSKIKGFRFKSSFKSWLYRVAVNTALNYIKKEKRQKTVNLENSITTVPETDTGVYDLIESRDTVSSLMGELDAKSRMILVMREIDGMSYADIAVALDTNISTVKTWIYRSREELRRVYTKNMKNTESNKGGEINEKYAPR
jgi:RNA polymerase sigma-70 factor (ECF subfamily)